MNCRVSLSMLALGKLKRTFSIFTHFFPQEYFTLGVKFSRVKMKSGGWKLYVVFRCTLRCISYFDSLSNCDLSIIHLASTTYRARQKTLSRFSRGESRFMGSNHVFQTKLVLTFFKTFFISFLGGFWTFGQC